MSNIEGCALVVFTRIPVPGKTKTRLMPLLSADECAFMQEAMVLDLLEKLATMENPVVLFHSDEWVGIEGGEAMRDSFIQKAHNAAEGAQLFHVFEQQGSGLGERMSHAMNEVFGLGANGCLLMGSDLPDIMKADVHVAERALEYSDVVFGPSDDGGYWLIGTSAPFPELFQDKEYGIGSVLTDAVATCRNFGKTVALSRETFDVDTQDNFVTLCNQVRKGDFRIGPRTVGAVKHFMDIHPIAEV